MVAKDTKKTSSPKLDTDALPDVPSTQPQSSPQSLSSQPQQQQHETTQYSIQDGNV
jgi:hypothetical protein